MKILVVLGDSPALLGMPDIELPGIPKVMLEVVEGQQADRKFDTQTMKLSSVLRYKANTDWRSRSDNVDVISVNLSMPDYFSSSIDREEPKRGSQLITQRIHTEFNDVFMGIGCFDGMFRL